MSAKKSRRTGKLSSDGAKTDSVSASPDSAGASAGSPESSVEPVTLRPIFGIEPGYWVTGLLAALALFALLTLLVLPGIIHPVADLTVDSTPPGAAIYYEGTRIGSTPQTITLPRGTVELELRRPGFHSRTRTAEVPSRFFGTLFATPRGELHVELDPTEEYFTTITERSAEDLAEWAPIGNSSASRPAPPILRDAARDLQAARRRPADRSGDNGPEEDVSASEIREFFLSSAQNITSHTGLRDLIAAQWTIEAGSGVPSPASALEMLHNIIQLNNESEAFSVWIESLGGSVISQKLRSSGIYETILSENRALEDGHGDAIAAEQSRLRPVTRHSAAGIEFATIPGGTVLLGFSQGLGNEDSGQVRSLRRVDTFSIAVEPVQVSQWRAFLDDNPVWRPENRDELIAQGIADRSYLREFSSQSSEEPVTEISWHAARAFANWLSDQAGSETTIRLPTEEEWARAAALDSFGADLSDRAFGLGTRVRPVDGSPNRVGEIGLFDMLGNVWEWTSTPYHFSDALLRIGDKGLASASGSPYAVVRGGSWANSRGEVGFETRGGQHRMWASPFLGFRVVAEFDEGD